jgi:uncharacterized protein (UPF0335 family)
MTDTNPPPGEPAWADIRVRYEKGEEKVEAIAAGLGMSRLALSLKALKDGWTLRGKRRAAAKTQAKAKRKQATPSRPESTRETILRLKDMLQKRVTQLEEELRAIGSEVNALNSERGINSVNTLVRTLDKVLELERKDKLKRKQARHDHKYFDDEQRRQLAAKIERLEAERDRDLVVADPDGGRGDGTEQPVALLGETVATASAETK